MKLVADEMRMMQGKKKKSQGKMKGSLWIFNENIELFFILLVGESNLILFCVCFSIFTYNLTK
jgi:hypothetical protein